MTSRVVGLNGLVGGQLADLNGGIQLAHCTHDKERLSYITYNKTVVLFEACAQVAACLGQATHEQKQQLMEYAHHFGFAFQMYDDIQDVDEDSSLSYASVYGIDQTKILIKEHVNACNSIALLSTQIKQLPTLLFRM